MKSFSVSDKKGYTFVELVIVLSIITVITAAALPAVGSLFISMTIIRLDRSAQTVYMSAQEELLAIKSSGALSKVADISSVSDGRTYLTPPALPLQNLQWLMDISGGTSAIVEYVPSSASVSAVFFSEQLSPGELEELYTSVDLLDASLRRKLRIGYYGGEPIDKLPPHAMLTPEIEVFNREDLYLRVTCRDIPNGATEENFKVELTLKNAHGETTVQIYNVSVPGDMLTAQITLDSMAESEIFALKYPELALSDVTAAAKITYTGAGESLCTPDDIMQKTAVTFNPLFESMTGGGIAVSRVRHLNNLRYIATENYTVKQTGDIAFIGIADDEFASNSARDLSIRTIPDFAGVFDGNDRLIKNISLNGSPALFGDVTGELRNIHLTGSAKIASAESEIGTLCVRLMPEGIIDNCSASEISVEASGGSTVGGLAAVCEGVIIRSSAILDDIRLGSGSTFGGITGRLDGGTVSLSHSAGRVASGGSCVISGISNGAGYIKNCYSELTAGYISGSEFFGIGDSSRGLSVSGCQFVLENAWLASDDSIAAKMSDLSIAGFDRPQRAVIGSESVSAFGWLPESVTRGGVSCRFGGWFFPEPRGVIGLLMITYNGGEYEYGLLHCFDAYGNDSSQHPLIEWDEPNAGDTRVFVFRSYFASPAGADGWEWSTDGSFGKEFRVGNYICCEISGQTSVTLRFADVERSAAFEHASGVIGVLTFMYDAYPFITDENNNVIYYLPHYRYIDLSTGTAGAYEYINYEIEAERLRDLEEYRFPVYSSYECRVFIFTSKWLSVDADWSADISPGGISGAEEYGDYLLYEIMRSETGDFSIDITLTAPGGVKKAYTVVCSPDSAESATPSPVISQR